MEKGASGSNWEVSLVREYQAFAQVLAQGEDSLGERRLGYAKAVRSKYYAFWGKAKGYMPTAIPLEKRQGSFTDFSAAAGAGAGVISFPAETYYLPGTNEVLRISPGIGRSSPKIPSEYYPESENFVGIDVLKKEGLDKGVFFDQIEEGIGYPRGELTPGEIEIILAGSAAQLKTSPESDSFVTLAQKLSDLKKQELQNEEEMGDGIRQKVSKIIDTLPPELLKKMPNVVSLLGDLSLLQQGKALFFVKDSITMITADYPGRGKEEVRREDLTSVEPAPAALWIDYGMKIIDNLLSFLPRDLRRKIEHPGRNF